MREIIATSDPELNSKNFQDAIDTLDPVDFIMLQPGMVYPLAAQTHWLRSGVRIYGCGVGGKAQIIMPQGFRDPAFANIGYISGGINWVDSGIGLYGLMIQGGGSTGVLNPQANPVLLFQGVAGLEVLDVLVTKSPGDGLYLPNHKQGKNVFQKSKNVHIRIEVRDADRNGITIVSADQFWLDMCAVSGSVNVAVDLETNQAEDSVTNGTIIGLKVRDVFGLGLSWGTHQTATQLEPGEDVWNQIANLNVYGCDILSPKAAYNSSQSATTVTLTECVGVSLNENAANFHVIGTVGSVHKQRQYTLDRCNFSAPKGEALSLMSGENFTANDTFLHDSQYGFRSRNTTGQYRGLTYANSKVKDLAVDKYMVAAAN